ncbi:unnamed protein product [Caenorhabditis angaria]|uniref:Galectin n=1 Tax=Caenorhabditis angaria TaxID=860376 RepID=A0A9P1IGW0_9PELO|nr:unnamed protein product [Caenorhabditis angaria]
MSTIFELKSFELLEIAEKLEAEIDTSKKFDDEYIKSKITEWLLLNGCTTLHEFEKLEKNWKLPEEKCENCECLRNRRKYIPPQFDFEIDQFSQENIEKKKKRKFLSFKYYETATDWDIQKETLKCGENKVETMYPDKLFGFENSTESGSIEWIGMIYDKTANILFRLNRAFGEQTEKETDSILEQNNSLSFEFHETRMLFYSRNFEGRYAGAVLLEQNILTQHNYKTSIKILIHKDRYDIFVNGEKQLTYTRTDDKGYKIGSAVQTGPFHPIRVILNCDYLAEQA